MSVLYDPSLDKAENRQKAFEEILVALRSQRTKAGKVFHIDVSRLLHEYRSIEQDIKERQA